MHSVRPRQYISVFDVSALLGLSMIYMAIKQTNKYLSFLTTILFNSWNILYIISVLLIQIEVKDIFEFKRNDISHFLAPLYFSCQLHILEITSDVILVLKWHWKSILFYFVIFVCLPQFGKKIWRQTQKIIVLALFIRAVPELNTRGFSRRHFCLLRLIWNTVVDFGRIAL